MFGENDTTIHFLIISIDPLTGDLILLSLFQLVCVGGGLFFVLWTTNWLLLQKLYSDFSKDMPKTQTIGFYFPVEGICLGTAVIKTVGLVSAYGSAFTFLAMQTAQEKQIKALSQEGKSVPMLLS